MCIVVERLFWEFHNTTLFLGPIAHGQQQHDSASASCKYEQYKGHTNAHTGARHIIPLGWRMVDGGRWGVWDHEMPVDVICECSLSLCNVTNNPDASPAGSGGDPNKTGKSNLPPCPKVSCISRRRQHEPGKYNMKLSSINTNHLTLAQIVRFLRGLVHMQCHAYQ